MADEAEAPKRSQFVIGDQDAVRDEGAHRNGRSHADDDSNRPPLPPCSPLTGGGASGHHRDNIWFGVGIHLPSDQTKVRRRRHRGHRQSSNDASKKPAEATEEDVEKRVLAPGQRVMFLLKEGEGGGDDNSERGDLDLLQHPLFTEMGELSGVGENQEWRETARWVKFEEDVEEGGDRWSKPHVATLSLHSLFELRSCLLNGMVILEMEADDLAQIIDIMLDKMIASRQLEFMFRDDVRDALLRRHTHQYEHGHGHKDASMSSAHGSSFLNTVRSLADIGRSFSHGRSLQHQDQAAGGDASQKLSLAGPKHLGLPKVGSLPRDVGHENGVASHADLAKLKNGQARLLVPPGRKESTFSLKGNSHFMKKLPAGVEASNVLVGEVDFLSHHISAFIRLRNAVPLGDLTEVPVPTRFLFVLLGATGHAQQYREIGRAIATLMADEIFHGVAYKARSRDDLLDGVDEFLDQVTVLPPGEWDPNIRIEPPSHVPSQEKRVMAEQQRSEDSRDDEAAQRAAAEEEHIDPSLRRTGRLFGGLMADVRRKLKWYKSDYTDGFSLQCVASFCFMYFALLAPIVTFGGLLEEATDKNMAAMENIFSAAICGVSYHVFSGQPLTVIGSTGPVLVFEMIVFNLCNTLKIAYLSFRMWINLWTGLILLLIVATDGSSLVSYITRFTEESFAILIAIIYIYEAIKKLIYIMHNTDVIIYAPSLPNATCLCEAPPPNSTSFKLDKLSKHYNWNLSSVGWYAGGVVDYAEVPLRHCQVLEGALVGDGCYHMLDVFYMSLVLCLGTFALAMTFKGMRTSAYFPTWVRQIVADFAVSLAIIIMVVVDIVCNAETPKLYVPSTFGPTSPERAGWLVTPFDGNPWWTAPAAVVPSLIACILIFMDQQITAVIVNRKENKLKKGCGYHLDLCVIALLIMVVGVLGLPIYVAATVLSINHVNSLRIESESRAPGEVVSFIGIRENRVTGIVTFVLIGASVMLTGILKLVPMPVLYGVFLYMGVSAFGGIQLFDRLLLMLKPMKYQPDYVYLRHVPIRRVHLFTVFQVVCLVLLWSIKSFKTTSIAFPIMLIVMVGVRKGMEHIFSDNELKQLDDRMPELHLRKRDDAKKKKEEAKKVAQNDTSPEEPPGGLRTVSTQGHLHIPMASGNVMKIPLSSIDEQPDQEQPINISEEMNRTGIWRHIASEKQINDLKREKDSLKHLAEAEEAKRAAAAKLTAALAPADDDDDDFEPITIKIQKPSPHASTHDVGKPSERQPLIAAAAAAAASPSSPDADDDDKQESSV